VSFRDIRTRLLVIVLAAVAVALVVATFGFAQLIRRSVDNNVRALLRQRVDSERAVITVAGGHIRTAESGLDTVADGRIWLFDGRRQIEAAPAEPETRVAVRSLVGGPRTFLDVPATDERLYAAPVTDAGGRRIGTIVAGVATAPYEETQHAAIVGAVLFAAVLLALVAAAAWWLLRSALRPVFRMTQLAEAWSEHDLDRRFAAGPAHDELSRLAGTLDRLLDRIGASLRHERRFTAELAHEVRTPLARAIGEAELALRRERPSEEYRATLDLVLRNTRQVARIVDTLVAAAQHEASSSTGTADALEVANEVASNLGAFAGERGIELEVVPPQRPLRVGADADIAARALEPVVENACRYGRSRVTIALVDDGNHILFRVLDDGPGLGGDDAERVFEPGVRGAAGESVPGAGLGLALARRIARSMSGDVSASVDPRGGGAFSVLLPRG
jgi:signal transduction histidine kinase